MKVRVDRDALEIACSLAAGLVPSRTTRPALKCLKLETHDKHLLVSATDGELGLTYRIGMVEIIEPGSAVLSADRFGGILRESRDESLDISTEGETCRVVGTDSRYKMFGFSPAEYPPVGDFSESAGFVVRAGVLKVLIARTSFAAAKEITRYAINGVLMEPRGDRLRMVGTDGKRLANAHGALVGTATEERAAVLPLKALTLLDKLLVDPEAEVEVRLTENDMKVRVGPAVLVGRLVEGTYPKYDEIIPKDADRHAQISTPALTSAIKRAALLVSNDSRRVVFKFSPERLELRSSAPEHGEAEIVISATVADGQNAAPDFQYTGAPLRVEFNPDYLLDGLKALGSDRAHLELKSADRPGVLRHAQEFIYLVMPLSVVNRGDD